MMTLKLNGFCGCIGCWRKVNDALSGIEGIERKLLDKKKFLVTVTGTVDTESLKAKLAKIRKSGKVEVIFQGDGERKEEEKKPKEEANTKQKEENPKEKSDTNQNKEMKEEEEQKEKLDKAKVKSEKTSPSTSNDADDSPSIRGGNSTEPMGEQNLEHGPAKFPCDYGFDYGPNVPFGNGPYDNPQGHADGIGPYIDPPPQDHAHDNGPYDYPQGHAHGIGPYIDPPPLDHAHDNGPKNNPPPQDHAQGNGPNKDSPPQEFAGEISNACSIM
ncbi:HEAVY METAL-ASSOCIATED ISOPRENYLATED PLANT PROTEIN 33-RELATED [Salix koriyanagi]|uniref:HEAVY METAL-ASSOCIATED ISOPRENYLATED PLANT PROTEIN 33-RELATED n=1 Tax=Salix koriyanagi TaxID=2511006 RepID=A0A9Q0X4B2_9ROSI|nr:HEAVY METAL-ASSOCIATED ISOPRENYLATED PLANT PROTEIN 33-RELATED [Salix koriyanagi]